MKKILFTVLSAVLLFSCQPTKEDLQNTEEYKNLVSENEKLKEEKEGKDQEINEFMASFNEIQKNLDIIKEKEKIVAVNTQDPELQNSKQQQIADDINLINELLNKNKQRINELNKRLKNSNIKIEELNKTIERLNNLVTQKDSEIAELQMSLEQANAAYKELFVEYNQRLDEIEEQTNKLNTAFYAFGTSKELKEKGVITKEGGFIGIGKTSKLTDDFNKDYFTQIDISTTNSIVLACKKAKVITTHPSNSYNLQGEQGKSIERINITKPEEFWSASKYLVIVTE